MQKRWVILLAALGCATALPACRDKAPAQNAAPVPPVAAPVAPAAPAADPWASGSATRDPLKNPLFWMIEKDGKTTYLLGTMHLGVDPMTRIPDIVWQKLDASPTFAMETDVTGNKLDVARHDGTTLRQELGEAYWKKLEGALGEAYAGRMLGYRPLVPALELAIRGLPTTAPMDRVLQGRALDHHEKIVFLEPFMAQATVLLRWMNAEALEEMLDDLPAVEQRSKDMLAAYLAGDDAKILAISDAERAQWKAHGHDEKKFDEQMEDLLYRRNESWITPIEKLHAEGGGFIAVGTAHLVGPRSVLELLSKKGYKVTRIAQ